MLFRRLFRFRYAMIFSPPDYYSHYAFSRRFHATLFRHAVCRFSLLHASRCRCRFHDTLFYFAAAMMLFMPFC